LQISETYFREVVESTPDGLMMVDQHGVIRLINTRMEQLFGYSRRELVGEKLSILLPEGFRSQHGSYVTRLLHRPSARHGQSQALFAQHRNGTQFPCEIGLNPMQVGGELLTLACISDVSERYYAKLDLEKGPARKNRAAGRGASPGEEQSAGDFQPAEPAGQNRHPEANKALLDSQNHVRSMALIHQLLYERNDFSRIPMSVYIERLTHLLRDVSTGYGSHIAFVFERNGPEAFLELQNSIPFGLILNEIVVNACKHAFTPGQPGKVEILNTEQQVNCRFVTTARAAPGVSAGHADHAGLSTTAHADRTAEGNADAGHGTGSGLLFHPDHSRPYPGVDAWLTASRLSKTNALSRWI
jgi:PAS domain S-box-containing protein